MSEQFRVVATTSKEGIRLSVTAPELRIKDRAFTRKQKPFANLTTADINSMRSGEAPPSVVRKVTDEVSKWFLADGLELLFEQIDNEPEGNPVRIIIKVEDELRADMTDVAFELTEFATGGVPLIMRKRIAALAYELEKTGAYSPDNVRPGGWPLRVLIVRANPPYLDQKVPPAANIKEIIRDVLAMPPSLTPDLVTIDVMSSEDNIKTVGRPTKRDLQERLDSTSYDILIYLGHGNIPSPITSKRSEGGVLELENDDNTSNDPLKGGELAEMLYENPAAVVLLMGCLTAADASKTEEEISNWMRGSQGVAQTLVNSQAGVHFVVGMRHRINTDDAKLFIRGFFRSLLKRSNPPDYRGNVEAAVRIARSSLRFGRSDSYSWSAPIIFRTDRAEPLFSFLQAPPPPVAPNTDFQQTARKIFWDFLKDWKWSWNQNEDLKHKMFERWYDERRVRDQEIIDAFLKKNASVIMPGFMLGREGEKISLPVTFYRELPIKELEATLILKEKGISIESLEASEQLAERGFQFIPMSNDGKKATFMIRHPDESGAPLEGELFKANLSLGPASEAIYTVEISNLKTTPAQWVCGSNNAVIVPSP